MNQSWSNCSCVIRLFQVIRLIGFLEKLTLLAQVRLAVTWCGVTQIDVQAFIEALKSVVWVMVLVIIIVYIFAVLGQVHASLVHGVLGLSGTWFLALAPYSVHASCSRQCTRV